MSKKKDRKYEEAKAVIRQTAKSPEEYESRIKKVVERLKV